MQNKNVLENQTDRNEQDFTNARESNSTKVIFLFTFCPEQNNNTAEGHKKTPMNFRKCSRFDVMAQQVSGPHFEQFLTQPEVKFNNFLTAKKNWDFFSLFTSGTHVVSIKQIKKFCHTRFKLDFNCHNTIKLDLQIVIDKFSLI